jgi:Uma2 family endonuclease
MYTIYNEETNRIEEVEEPDHSLTYTYANYSQWKFLERLELLRGRIFRLASPSIKHQRICLKLAAHLYTFLRGKTCQVIIPPYDIRLPVKNRKKDDEVTTVVQPDLSVFCDPLKVEDRAAIGAPDLLVEVLSPGNTRYDLHDKYEIYQEACVKEYWIVDPVKASVQVSLLAEEGRFGPAEVRTGDQLLQPRSLPGFSIAVKDLFTP